MLVPQRRAGIFRHDVVFALHVHAAALSSALRKVLRIENRSAELQQAFGVRVAEPRVHVQNARVVQVHAAVHHLDRIKTIVPEKLELNILHALRGPALLPLRDILPFAGRARDYRVALETVRIRH